MGERVKKKEEEEEGEEKMNEIAGVKDWFSRHAHAARIFPVGETVKEGIARL